MATIKGGEKLAAALAHISANASNATTLQVGFLAGSTYPDGTPVPLVAAVQEFGAPKAGIPPRPFMRTMVAKKSGEWPKALGTLLKTYDYDATKALTGMGEVIQGQLQQSIIDTTSPPLSPITLMLRKMFGNHPEEITGKAVGEAARRVAAGESSAGVSTKPLEWTGHLLHSVTYKVGD